MIRGTYLMPEYLEDAAKKHPDKRFIIYDSAAKYTECDLSNSYSILCSQNEGAYLTDVKTKINPAEMNIRDGRIRVKTAFN